MLYLDHCAEMSGGEIALLRLVASLPDKVEAVLITAENGPLIPEVRSVGVETFVLPVASGGTIRKEDVTLRGLGLGSVIAWWRHAVGVARVARRARPHVIHTNSLKSALYGGLVGRLLGIPVVWHIRDGLTPEYLPATALRLLRLTGRVLPSAVVTNSNSTLSAFELLVGRRATRRLAPQVMFDVLPESSYLKPKETYGQVLRIVMVGRLAPWKGQDLFLRAFARLVADHPDLTAVVAGSAMFGEHDYADSLRDLAQELGIADRVAFEGFVEDVGGLLRSSDLLVHASTIAEPFGQVIVEGMAAGLPVVAADSGGPREIIVDGVDGVLFETGSVESLTMSLRSLVEDEIMAERLGRAAMSSATRFKPERSTTRLVSMYEGLPVDRARSRKLRRKLTDV